MATQPTVDTDIKSEFSPHYCYVATVPDAEFVAGLGVTYTTKAYTAVTRSGETAHNCASATNTVRAAITGATSPGSNFVAIIRFYNESTTINSVLLAGKSAWNQANGFYIAQKTNANTLEFNGGSNSGFPTITATDSGLTGATHTLVAEFSGTTVTLSMDGSSLGSVTLSAAAGSWPSGLGIGNFSGTGAGNAPTRSIMMAAILGSKGSKTLDELSSDPYLIFDSAAGSATTVISATLANVVGSLPSKAIPISSISATLANISGSLTSGSGSLVTTIAATLGNVVGAITSTGSTANGTFTSEVLKDYAGNVLANTALNFVRFYNDTTGALVLNKTGVTTNGSGIVTFSDAALVAGVTYRVDWETAAGSRRMPRKAAA